MSTRKKCENIRIPILKKSEYPTCMVDMLMFPETTNADYLERIHYGPNVPIKLVSTTVVEGRTIPEYYAL